MGRDAPEAGTAAFISLATEKVSVQSGAKTTGAGTGGDEGERRLKKEIMALPARDRRRLKGIVTEGGVEEGSQVRGVYEASYNAGRIAVPVNTVKEGVGVGVGGGITDKNWNLEIRKRYAQPLFSESLEFPDSNAIQARMVPICYEAGLTSGASANCAELVAIAAETYVKNMLQDVFNRVRSNGPVYENGAGSGIFTASYRRKLNKEDIEVKSGRMSRNREDELLPTESKEANARRPIAIADLKLANQVGPTLWNGAPTIGARVENMMFDAEFPWNDKPVYQNGGGHQQSSDTEDDSDMDLDDPELGWEGATRADQASLGKLLSSCLELAGPV